MELCAPLALTSPGTYVRVNRMPRQGGLPALFLDRDGVLVEEVGYLHKPEDLLYLRNAFDGIRKWNAAGLPVILVTNQAGVGRGMYDWRQFEMIQEIIESELEQSGAWLDAVLACGYHEDGIGELGKDHNYRKPRPGMLWEAKRRMGISLSGSWMVGDKLSDLEAAARAGVRRGVLVSSGYGIREAGNADAWRNRHPGFKLTVTDLFPEPDGEVLLPSVDRV